MAFTLGPSTTSRCVRLRSALLMSTSSSATARSCESSFPAALRRSRAPRGRARSAAPTPARAVRRGAPSPGPGGARAPRRRRTRRPRAGRGSGGESPRAAARRGPACRRRAAAGSAPPGPAHRARAGRPRCCRRRPRRCRSIGASASVCATSTSRGGGTVRGTRCHRRLEACAERRRRGGLVVAGRAARGLVSGRDGVAAVAWSDPCAAVLSSLTRSPDGAEDAVSCSAGRARW